MTVDRDKLARLVIPCHVCEGEGEIADGLDEAACSMPCPVCGGNAWLVDLQSISDQGYVLAPKVATEEIVAAGQQAYEHDWEYGLDNEDMALVYTAMISAIQPPANQESEG